MCDYVYSIAQRPFYDSLHGDDLDYSIDSLSPSSRDHSDRLHHSHFSYSVNQSPSPTFRVSPESPRPGRRRRKRHPKSSDQHMPLVGDLLHDELESAPIVNEMADLSLTDWLASPDIDIQHQDPSTLV